MFSGHLGADSVTADDPQAPPADIAAEQALLGACLSTPRALDDAIEHLAPQDFYRPAHGELFAAMVAMRDAGREVDAVTLGDHLGDRLARLGGPGYLLDLTGAVVTATNAAYYAEIITGHSLRRQLDSAGRRAVQLSRTLDTDPTAAVERAREALDAIAIRARGGSQAVEIDSLAASALARYHDPAPRSLSTGWRSLDEIMLGGLRPGALTIIGARPSTGKSLVAAGLALNAALRGHGALIVSLEMNRAELTDRIIANLASVYLDRLIRHALSERDWAAVEAAARSLRGMPLAIIDDPHLGLTEIRSHARDRLRTPRGLSLLVIDYLGLMRPADTRVDRQQQVAAMSRGTKLLARELDIPVVALHQLNRQPEMRPGRVPGMADLRDSGAVEQDADNIWLLHRDENDDEQRWSIKFMIAKNRNGRTGTVELLWSPEYARVGDYPNLKAAG